MSPVRAAPSNARPRRLPSVLPALDGGYGPAAFPGEPGLENAVLLLASTPPLDELLVSHDNEPIYGMRPLPWLKKRSWYH